jgi:hypothetical protein
MIFPRYNYQISNEKYQARLDIFKYLVGLQAALLAASVFGLEKIMALLGKSAISVNTIEGVRLASGLLMLSIVQGIVILVLNYHHKFYNAPFLDGHKKLHHEMPKGIKRNIFGIWVFLEHSSAVVSAYLLKFLASTWLIIPVYSLVLLALAYKGIAV